MEAPQQPHIAMLLTPGMGHLIPLTELARKLVHLHSFSVTFIILDDGVSSTKTQLQTLLQTLPNPTNSILLPPPPDIAGDITAESRVVLSTIRSGPSLRKALTDLKESIPTRRISAFVADLFGIFTLDVAKELDIPAYLFFTSTAMTLSFSLHLPELNESSTCDQYRDLPEPLKLPGLVPVRGSDFMDPTQDRKTDAYKGCVEMCRKYRLADGILVNSFFDLEPDTFNALDQNNRMPPIYPIGPLIRPGSKNIKDGLKCLEWLDKQPLCSVLYVSFGSEGTLSRDQLNELVSGLRMSEQRFLLVAKNPRDCRTRSSHHHDEYDQCAELTEWTTNNNNIEKGFVLPSKWAPQVEILAHVAVGGFLTHCGWNSTLEGIVNGVPLIAWPLYAEQKMNAVLLSEGLKVAIRVREGENGIVDREQISRLARDLIEGEVLRKRMWNLKEGATRALSQDGSSNTNLANVAAKWMEHP
ncbi:hypothetical protein ABFX02_01G065000 [Erythranthe guttata]